MCNVNDELEHVSLADLLYEAEAYAAAHGNADLRRRLRDYREGLLIDDDATENQSDQVGHGAPPSQEGTP